MKMIHVLKSIALTMLLSSSVVIMWPRQVEAQSFPTSHMSEKECTVTSSVWTMHPAQYQLSLPRAMYHANQGESSADSACKRRVSLEVDQIDMRGDLPIAADYLGSTNGTQDVLDDDGKPSRFVLAGGCAKDDISIPEEEMGKCDNDTFSGKTTFDASYLRNHADLIRENSHGDKCLVRVINGYVILKDLIFTGVPEGVHAICLEGGYTLLDGVEINSGANGVVAYEGSQYNLINARSSIQGLSGQGVVFEDANPNSYNSIESFNGTIGETDENGFSTLSADGDRFRIEGVNGGPENWIRSSVPVKVKIISKEVVQDDPPYVLLMGMFVNGEDAGCTADDFAGVSRVHVYADGLVNTDGSGATRGFTGFIGRRTDDGAYGIDSQSGFFQVKLPYDDDNAAVVVLIPEKTGGTMGMLSVPIPLDPSNDGVECPDREYGGEAGAPGGSGGAGGASGGARFRGYWDEPSCLDGRHIRLGGTAPETHGYDSDGDGILDRDEDTDNDCHCGTTETCWYLFDTDGDGVPDGAGGETLDDVTDYDNDDLPAALDNDSDEDGLSDGEEDRNYYFGRNAGTNSTEGLLYRYQSAGELQPVTDLASDSQTRGHVLTCELGAGQNVGVRYSKYIVSCGDELCATFDQNPVEITAGAPGADTRFTTLVCRRQSLYRRENFNGVRETSNSELDPTKPDTDDDTFCDGNGTGCEGAVPPIVDQCPLINDARPNCGGRGIECQRDQVFFGVQPEWVDWSGSQGTPDGFKDNYDSAGRRGRDGTPDIVQVSISYDGEMPDELPIATRASIEAACPGDTDDDGIPDCVEVGNAEFTCPNDANEFPSADNANSWKLKYYMADSDGDGLVDGYKGGASADVCPETNGTSDTFVEGSTGYSCDPDQVYVHVERKSLAYFLDRDNDEQRDAAEDIDRDGAVDAYRGDRITLEIKQTVLESSPLSKDTDADGLTDKQEWEAAVYVSEEGELFTNPADPDTDDDELFDGTGDPAVGIQGEDRDGSPGIQISDVDVNGTENCVGAMTFDTNPVLQDTDGDSLTDGQEVLGEILVDDDFIRMITEDPNAWTSGGIDVVSNPRSKDSDNDDLDDDEEYNGTITYQDSNPCMRDSDGDQVDDIDEGVGCKLNPDRTCTEGAGPYNGVDTDNDGLPDSIERALGTDPSDKDSDDDGAFDGVEDANHDGIVSPGESDPLIADTDGDALIDGLEYRLGTDPYSSDTDGDGIIDGLEDANHNGNFDAASETNPMMTDTDGDTLCDGNCSGIGEDLNVNGIVDLDPQGRFLETNPRIADSDLDGCDDRCDMFAGGSFSRNNTARATQGKSSGGIFSCNTIVPGATPDSTMALFGLILALNRFVVGRLRMKRKG